MGPQTNVKMPGSDTGQIESWENQEKIEKKKIKKERSKKKWEVFEMLYGISLLVMQKCY